MQADQREPSVSSEYHLDRHWVQKELQGEGLIQGWLLQGEGLIQGWLLQGEGLIQGWLLQEDGLIQGWLLIPWMVALVGK